MANATRCNMTDKTKHSLKITTIMSIVGACCGFLGVFGARFVFVTEGERALGEKVMFLSEVMGRMDERQQAMQRSIDVFLATNAELSMLARDTSGDLRTLEEKHNSLSALVHRNIEDIKAIRKKLENDS